MLLDMLHVIKDSSYTTTTPTFNLFVPRELHPGNVWDGQNEMSLAASQEGLESMTLVKEVAST
jgi:hypothetical protein